MKRIALFQKRTLALLFVGLSLVVPTAIAAGTPREAQIASHLTSFLSYTLFSALTGWNTPGVDALPRRRCNERDIERLVDYSNRGERDMANNIYRSCELVRLVSYKKEKNNVVSHFTIKIAEEYCIFFEKIFLDTINEISKIQTRPDVLFEFYYALKLPNKNVDTKIFIDIANSYASIKHSQFFYKCSGNKIVISVATQ